jgi:hypothetical protein
MARPRNQQTGKFTAEELNHLAGVYNSSIQGLKSTNTSNATAISKYPYRTWTDWMAKTFGGESKEFTSERGKTFWGWYTTLEQRLSLLAVLEKAGVLKDDPTERDAVRARLEGAIERKNKDAS